MQKACSLNPNRSLGFVKLRAYARQITLRPAEGVAGYGETGHAKRRTRVGCCCTVAICPHFPVDFQTGFQGAKNRSEIF